MPFKENCKAVAHLSYRLIFKLTEICKKIALWSLIQIDRTINPRKYETEDDRIERHRREDREHEIRMAKLTRETHHYEHQVNDGPNNQGGFNNTNRYLREEIGFDGHYSEFDQWNGSGDGYSRMFKQKKGRKPKDPWF